MGVEMIKDRQGKDHLVFTDEDFCNDDIMGSKFEDYEILQVLSKDCSYGFASKVRSKINSKIYAMKKIDSNCFQGEQIFNNEFEKLKQTSFPNITKYFKYFIQDSCLYIIYEYVNNADLLGFLDAYKSIEKPIEEDTLLNIFMQCISALKHCHSQNIIHKNISLTNIFMSENKIIKLGDFKFSFLDNRAPKEEYQSPEMKNNLHYNKKTDIYALGSVFHQLCYFSLPNEAKKNTNFYSKQIEHIINLMLKKESERPDSNYIYKLIMEEYIKNVARITSIDSVFRCMFSFMNFTQNIMQKAQIFSNENMTPIAFNYMNCIQRYFSDQNPRENAINLNNFRNLLYNNSQINNEIEIKPSLVIEYLLEKLNKETSTNFNGPSLAIQTSNFNRSKDQSYNEFNAYFRNNFTSDIAKNFIGFIKTKRICKVCREGLYSFNLFPFIEFDLDMTGQDPNLENWFYMQNNNCCELSAEHNVVCQQCKCIREHYEFKQFYSMPQNFIISFNRGEGFKNTTDIKIPLGLDLNKKVEKPDSPIKFKLVGIVKRVVDNKDFESYIAIYFDPFKNTWILSDKNGISQVYDPLFNKDGMVMLLFYSAIISIGN